jgi:DeoR family transcriptional regulator of aga operon
MSAIHLATVVNFHPMSVYKLTINPAETRAIANRAAEFINRGDVIGLSGGQICTQLALRIRRMKGITVITNAANIAVELAGLDGINVRLLGGMLNSKSFELVGGSVGLELNNIHINHFFLGTDAVTVDFGVTAHNEAEALVAQEIIAHSDRTILLADSTKFDKPALARVAFVSSIDAIVTTELTDSNILEKMKNNGVICEIASFPKNISERSYATELVEINNES